MIRRRMARLLRGLKGSRRRGTARIAASARRFRRQVRIERLTVYALDLDGDGRPARSTAPGGSQVVEATTELLDAMARQHQRELTDRKEQILRCRVGSGHRRLFVTRGADGSIVGYSHLVTSDDTNDRIGYRVRLRAGEVYLFDSHVFAPHRRRGHHRHSIAARLSAAATAGATRAITIITDTNEASIRSFGAFGFRPVRRLVHLPAAHRTVALPTRAALTHPSRTSRRR